MANAEVPIVDGSHFSTQADALPPMLSHSLTVNSRAGRRLIVTLSIIILDHCERVPSLVPILVWPSKSSRVYRAGTDIFPSSPQTDASARTAGSENVSIRRPSTNSR